MFRKHNDELYKVDYSDMILTGREKARCEALQGLLRNDNEVLAEFEERFYERYDASHTDAEKARHNYYITRRNDFLASKEWKDLFRLHSIHYEEYASIREAGKERYAKAYLELEKAEKDKPLSYCNIDIGCDLEKFKLLLPGDILKVDGMGEDVRCTVTGRPYYNSDSDEKGWEVETSNGVIALENDIVITGHDDEEFPAEAFAPDEDTLNGIHDDLDDVDEGR